jgi:hypothetical protein
VELVVKLINTNASGRSIQIGGPGEFPALTEVLDEGTDRDRSYGRRPVGSSATFTTNRGDTVTCVLTKAYNHRTAAVFYNGDDLFCEGW